jgi:hypothetical protein
MRPSDRQSRIPDTLNRGTADFGELFADFDD